MSSSLLLRRGAALGHASTSSVSRSVASVRCASTGDAINKGPSTAESQPQGSDNRGKTTTYVLPAVAGAMVVGALAWRFASPETRDVVPIGVKEPGKANKAQGGSGAVPPRENPDDKRHQDINGHLVNNIKTPKGG